MRARNKPGRPPSHVRMTLRPALLFMALAIAAPPAVAADAFDHRHGALDALLRQHVRDGSVDYASLQARPKPLDDCLDRLAAVTETEFNPWPEKDRLAFLINLYNAATLKLIADHYPVKSIKDIGGFFRGPWKQPVVRLFGRTITLDDLEHGIIRAQYPDARVHFALVCGAKGCPPLRAESYAGWQLDAQLDDQGRVFLAQSAKNRVEAAARTVWLSPLFKWFAEDFETAAGSMLQFVTPFFPEAARHALAGGDFKVDYTSYDWSLNDQAKR